MKRYYLDRTVIFDTEPYDYVLFKETIAKVGGHNVRLCHQNGKRNLPKVVTFGAEDQNTLNLIEVALEKVAPFEGHWIARPMIREKNW